MCGIWSYISTKKIKINEEILFSEFNKLKHRGPDRSDFKIINDFTRVFAGFHRLAIMDRSTCGDQPFIYEKNGRTIYFTCNGEIYNYLYLIEKFSLETKSKSDCEVIPLLYLLFCDPSNTNYCGKVSEFINLLGRRLYVARRRRRFVSAAGGGRGSPRYPRVLHEPTHAGDFRDPFDGGQLVFEIPVLDTPELLKVALRAVQHVHELLATILHLRFQYRDHGETRRCANTPHCSILCGQRDLFQ